MCIPHHTCGQDKKRALEKKSNSRMFFHGCPAWDNLETLLARDNDNDNDNDTLREVPHPSNEGLALQARV